MQVRLSDDEHAALRHRAATAGVSVPRLLLDAADAGDADPSAAPRATMVAVPAGGRRRRTSPGRPHQLGLRVSDAELAALSGRADAAGVSIQRLLVETTLATDRVTPGERRGLYATLMASRRVLAGAANNLNQLTRWSHAHEVAHPELDRAMAAVNAAAARLTGAVVDVDEALYGPVGAVDPEAAGE